MVIVSNGRFPSVYGVASFKEGEALTAPALTLLGRKKEADKLQTAEGWAKFTGGFFFSGISGVIWAYFLIYIVDLPYTIKLTPINNRLRRM